MFPSDESLNELFEADVEDIMQSSIENTLTYNTVRTHLRIAFKTGWIKGQADCLTPSQREEIRDSKQIPTT